MILYVVYNDVTKLTKIGITDNIERRVKQLENSGCVKLHLITWVDVNNAIETEKYLHSKYAPLRHHGEWFNLEKIDKEDLKHFFTEEIERQSHPQKAIYGGKIEKTISRNYVVNSFIEVSYEGYEHMKSIKFDSDIFLPINDEDAIINFIENL